MIRLCIRLCTGVALLTAVFATTGDPSRAADPPGFKQTKGGFVPAPVNKGGADMGDIDVETCSSNLPMRTGN
jgi:hypothetical protein